jgi:tetratricopeptide (TPR) repeat protein
MEERLRKIQTADKAFVVQESTDEIDSIVNYFEKHPSKELLPLSYYYAGRIYSDLEDAPQALDYFQKVLECEPQDSLAALAHSQMGSLLLRQRMVTASIEHVQAAYEYDVQQADTTGMIFDLRDMGNAFRCTEDEVDSCLTYYEEALRLATEQGDALMQEELKGSIAVYLIQTDSLQAAWQLLHPLLVDINQRDASSASTLRSTAAEYYLKTGDTDSACIFFEQLTESGTLYAKQEAYRQLAKHSLAKGDLQKAAELLLNYEKYTDSIAITMQTEALSQADALFSYRLWERENQRLMKTMTKTKTIAAGAIGLLLLGGFTMLFLHERNKRKHIAQLLRMERMKEVQEQQYKRSLAFIEENEKKMKELEEQMEKTGQENTLLRKTIQKLKYANELASIQMQEHQQADKQVKSSAIYQRIQIRLNNKESIGMNDEIWKELEEVVEQAYSGFLKRIEDLCPLNWQERNLCLLLKAGFTPSNIAILTAHSKQSISSTRSRLYERTFLEKGTSSQWDEFIQSI